MHTRSQGQENLVPINPEIGRRRRRRKQRKMVVEHPKCLWEYAMPDGSLGSSIVQPAITAANYEIKLAFFQFIVQNQFFGSEMEHTNDHLDEFVNKCGTVKYQGISNEQMKLICFPYSLRGEARDWLRSEGPNKYRTGEALSKAFLARFFSLAKTAKLRNDITSFREEDSEASYEAWERYKGLQRKCPYHGIPDWLLIQNVYNSLRDEIQISVDAAARGTLMAKTPEVAKQNRGNVLKLPLER